MQICKNGKEASTINHGINAEFKQIKINLKFKDEVHEHNTIPESEKKQKYTKV